MGRESVIYGTSFAIKESQHSPAILIQEIKPRKYRVVRPRWRDFRSPHSWHEISDAFSLDKPTQKIRYLTISRTPRVQLVILSNLLLSNPRNNQVFKTS